MIQAETGNERLHKISSDAVGDIKKGIKICEEMKKHIESNNGISKDEVEALLQLLKNQCLAKLKNFENTIDSVGYNGNSKIEDGIKNHFDAGVMYINQTVEERYKELEDNLRQINSSNADSLNKNLVDSTHRLYTDICNEGFKGLRKLKKQITVFRNVAIILEVIIIATLLLNPFAAKNDTNFIKKQEADGVKKFFDTNQKKIEDEIDSKINKDLKEAGTEDYGYLCKISFTYAGSNDINESLKEINHNWKSGFGIPEINVESIPSKLNKNEVKITYFITFNSWIDDNANGYIHENIAEINHDITDVVKENLIKVLDGIHSDNNKDIK